MKRDQPAKLVPRGKASPRERYRVQEALRREFYKSVREILERSRANAYRAVNFAMVEAYWKIGRLIVEEEQQGEGRAEYGASLLHSLALRLSMDLGKGFDARELRKMRQFYVLFPIRDAPRPESLTESLETFEVIRSALRSELTWTHYRLLIRVQNPEARQWYLNEAADENWSTRALERQINSLYYERLRLSRDKDPVEAEAQDMTAPLASRPPDFIKDPYVLEFLGLPDAHAFREAELEQAIIGKLQSFMLELGKGFAFVARQKRVCTDTKDREKALILRDRGVRYA